MAGDHPEEFTPVTGEEFGQRSANFGQRCWPSFLWFRAAAFRRFYGGIELNYPAEEFYRPRQALSGCWLCRWQSCCLWRWRRLASAKRLVIGANCVQLLSGQRVVIHIPYGNVAETYSSGEAGPELSVCGCETARTQQRLCRPGLRTATISRFWRTASLSTTFTRR